LLLKYVFAWIFILLQQQNRLPYTICARQNI
jgi:hypothetical protein